MIQLLLHLLGDYILQSDWMALNKNRMTSRCLAHVVLYTIPFALITHSPLALAFIFATHFLLDRYSLAKYLIYIKNHLNPTFSYFPWKQCCNTGYYDITAGPMVDPAIRPPRITVWLYIITDNGLHLACNWFAITFL